MSEHENVTLVKRWFKEVWNEGRTDTVRELLAPRILGVGQVEDGSMITTPEEFLVFQARLRAAFSNFEVTIEDAFAAGDKVAARWVSRGIHTGDQLGVPPQARKL
jgi:predicted ester cyclase